MIAVRGTYEDGKIELEKIIRSPKKINVIVTFLDTELEEDKEILSLDDFSFKAAREQSKRYKGNISDAVIEERRSQL